LKTRLYQIAGLTSPIIALYGVSPLYFLDRLNIESAFIISIGLSINVFIFWSINIFLISRFSNWNKAKLYSISFVLVFLTHIPKIWIAPIMPFSNILDRYITYPIITTVAINAIIWIIINSILLGEKNRSAEAQVEQLKIKNLEAQKQVLIQQLNPHFLFNALSVLKSLIRENVDDAEDYTVKLSDFLRYAVEAHKHEIVLLEDELQFVKDYIALQKVRFEKAFSYELDIPAEVLQHQLPIFALQTLVENIFKHNFFTEKNPIHFSIIYKDGFIKVWNKKVSVKLTERTATGLQNLDKRYTLITGKGIEIVDGENDFWVQINLIKK
jgi:two-component system, LytTR family, sensor kinase